jgi:hypothetical protein
MHAYELTTWMVINSVACLETRSIRELDKSAQRAGFYRRSSYGDVSPNGLLHWCRVVVLSRLSCSGYNSGLPSASHIWSIKVPISPRRADSLGYSTTTSLSARVPIFIIIFRAIVLVMATSNGVPNEEFPAREPIKVKGVLEQFKYFDVTPCIGREYENVNLKDWLRDPNSDDLIRDLAITSLSTTQSSRT